MIVAEWQAAVDAIRAAVENTDKNVILVPDVAYLDYSGEKKECRKFFKVFGNLPKTILVIVAYTLSKEMCIRDSNKRTFINKGVCIKCKDKAI